MSSNINRVNISGNLTRDPELRSTPGGTQVLTFGVAVNDRRRNSAVGRVGRRAELHRLRCFWCARSGSFAVPLKGCKSCH